MESNNTVTKPIFRYPRPIFDPQQTVMFYVLTMVVSPKGR